MTTLALLVPQETHQNSATRSLQDMQAISTNNHQ